MLTPFTDTLLPQVSGPLQHLVRAKHDGVMLHKILNSAPKNLPQRIEAETQK